MYLTFYTNRLPDGVGGAANGPVIRIRPQYKGDAGLLAHEVEHVRQWWVLTILSAPLLFLIDPVLVGACIGVHPLLYLAVKPYRLWCEVRAYRIQMQAPDAAGNYLSLDRAAVMLADPRYRLNLSIEQARQNLE